MFVENFNSEGAGRAPPPEAQSAPKEKAWVDAIPKDMVPGIITPLGVALAGMAALAVYGASLSTWVIPILGVTAIVPVAGVVGLAALAATVSLVALVYTTVETKQNYDSYHRSNPEPLTLTGLSQNIDNELDLFGKRCRDDGSGSGTGTRVRRPPPPPLNSVAAEKRPAVQPFAGSGARALKRNNRR